jgi:hypothetical protein
MADATNQCSETTLNNHQFNDCIIEIIKSLYDIDLKQLIEKFKTYEELCEALNKPIKTCLNSDNELLKLRLFIDSLTESMRKRYGMSHQSRMDLIARLAADWPEWGLSFDYLNCIIIPFLKNTILHHFINLSEKYDISNTFYEFYSIPDKSMVDIDTFKLDDHKLRISYTGKTCEGCTDNLPCLSVLSHSAEWERKGSQESDFEYKWGDGNDYNILLRIRNANVGMEAFNVLIEGILRNTAKHGLADLKDEKLLIRVILTGSRDIAENFVLIPKASQLGNEFNIFNEAELGNRFKNENGNIVPDHENDDYFYVIVTSNKDTFIDNSEESLCLLINNYICDRIVDKRGEINPENWGFKEMKIAAAFLAGEDGTATNEVKIQPSNIKAPPHYLFAATTKNISFYDNKSRLAYVFKIQKPRNVLIWATSDEIKQFEKKALLKYEKHGWRFVFQYESEGTKDLNDLTKLSWKELDYEMLFVMRGRINDYINNFIDNETSEDIDILKSSKRTMIPHRIIMEDNNISISLPRTDEELNKDITDKLFAKLYNEWLKLSTKKHIEKYAQQNNEYSFGIYFDGNNIINNFPEKPPCFGGIRVNNCKLNDHFDKILNDKNTVNNMYIIQHRKLPVFRKGSVPDWDSKGFYYQFGTSRDPFFSMFRSTLLAPEGYNSKAAEMLIYKYIESAMIRILIIDERITQMTFGKIDREQNIALTEKLRWLGIFVAREIKVDGDKGVIQNDKLKFVEANSSEYYFDISIKGNEITGHYFNGTSNYPNALSMDDIDVIFIHHTKFKIICELLGVDSHNEIERDKLILKWKKRKGNTERIVLIHSGKGVPKQEKPRNAPFVEFSTLQRNVLYETSKFYLAQIALNAKEGKSD